jgi:CBS domain-containing protein
MGDEPPSPKAEFMMAGAGPLSSILISLVFYGVYAGGKAGFPGPINGVVGYLASINAILAGFNLVPAFPLDGGRMLRAALWHWKNNVRWATRVTSNIGSGFGVFMILIGLLHVLGGNFVGGMWLFLIGMFLRGAAQASYQQLVTRRALEGEPVKRFMKRDPVTVSPSTTLKALVEDYLYKYHFKMFPVVENQNRLIGCVTATQVKEIPRDEWINRTVGQTTKPCSEENTVRPEDDAVKAMSVMKRSGNSRLMVAKENHLLGVITLKDLMEFLSLKIELDEPLR